MTKKEYREVIDKLVEYCDSYADAVIRLRKEIELRDCIIDKQQKLLRHYGCEIEL